MYFDTPRDFIDGVYEELVYGDHPLGWDIIGRKETVQDATRETFTDYLDQLVQAVADGRRRRRACSATDLVERIEELLGDLEDAPTGSPLPAPGSANGSRVRVHTKESDQAHICLGVRSRPIVDPDRYVLHGARDRARRRDVVAALHRGARAARARLLRLRHEPLVHGRGLAVLAGRRRHRADRRGGRDDREPSCGRSRPSRCRTTSCARRRTSRRDGSCSRSRARTG